MNFAKKDRPYWANYNIKSIINPDIIPIKYNSPAIVKFCFICLFDLNNTKIPIPEPTNNPAIIEPRLIKFDKYNSVIITEPAQFGIKPNNADTNIPTKGTLAIAFEMFSSPIKCTMVFNIM